MEKTIKESCKITGKFRWVLCNAETQEIVEFGESENLVCNRGMNAIASRLNGETTYTGIINYLGVGTSTASPLVTDTQLGSEIARTTIAFQSRINNVVKIGFFFNSASANGILTEVGAFIDGTASSNSGQIFDHATLPSVVKTLSETLTITLTVTVS